MTARLTPESAVVKGQNIKAAANIFIHQDFVSALIRRPTLFLDYLILL